MMRQGKARDRLQNMSVKLRQHAAALVDSLIVLALFGLALLEIWTSPFATGPHTGLLLINTLLFFVVCLGFLWRRRAPIAVLLLTVTLLSVQANFLDPRPAGEPPFSSFIIFLVISYSVAVYGEGRLAVVVAAVALATEILTIDVPRFLIGINAGDIVPAWVLYVLFWFIGRTIRRRRLQAEHLEDLAARLEREREEKARVAVAEERSRISRELHDVIVHSVSVMVVQAQAAQRLLEGEQNEARQALGSIETTGRQALAEMRRLLGILRRTDAELALAPQPSLRHLEVLIAQVRDSGLPVELHVEGEVRTLPPGVDLSAYRILQEALTNTLKHAGPASARVEIHYEDDEVELEVSDDGPGTGRGGGSGQGLVGMRERAALYGGVLESGKCAGGGYLVRARLPLDPDQP